MHVKVENVSKSFGDTRVLNDVSLDVEHNDFFTILGPTGHGKTTLLRILAGTETPDEGRVYFDGKDVTDVPPQKRPVSLVFQDFALYRNMNVYDNIASPLKAKKKFTSEEIDKKVKEKAKMLGIENLLDRSITEMSGGEAQRVAIARSLAKESELLLLDEPLTNLDFKIRERMRRELREIKAGTTILATPDPLEALAMSFHVAVMLNGRILQQGEVTEVYRKPKSIDVGSYFSYPPMNFLDAKLVKEDGTYYLKASDELKIEATHIKNLLGEKDECILGIRGRNLIEERERENMLSITATVQLIESKGSECIVHLDYRGSPMRQYVPRVARHEIGKKLRLFVDPEKLYVFDGKTQNLITRYQRPKS